MGACCVVERSSSCEADSRNEFNYGYNSVLINQDTITNTVGYNLVYRPPCLNARLNPGEARPRFWVNPDTPSKGAAVVSIAWGTTQDSPYPQYIACNRNSKRNSIHGFIKKFIKDGDVERKSVRCDVTCERPSLDCGDNNLNIKSYPDFLLPFIDEDVRLRLVCLDARVVQLVGAHSHLKQGMQTDPSAELSHLIRNMHWLRLHLTYSRDVNGMPQVHVKEHHGGIKRLKKVRYRVMSVNWIDMDHRKPAIKVIGDSFLLSLVPPSSNLRPEDFPEGNGEIPSALGIYIRKLDSAADTKIQFSARLFRRYSQSANDNQTISDVNTNLSSDSYFEEKNLHQNISL